MPPRAFIALFLLAVAPACPAQSFVDGLSAKGSLGVSIARARELESRLGQLLVINVDGFGYTGSLALSPAYAELVKRLQVGGVIPHYGSTDYERIRRTNRALAEMTRQPILICCDIVKIEGAGVTRSFGDGYVGGFLGKYKHLPNEELSTLAALNGLAFAAIGVNVALGPTIDDSTGDPRTAERARVVMEQWKSLGLEPVIKHFPFLPTGTNLHRASPDTKVAPKEAEKRYAVFKELAPEAGLMMSTHLLDTKVDGQIATFSRAWINLLRKRTGFDGLLMSDGLLMLANYTDRAALAGGPSGPELKGLDETAVWALRAILAGHDMVIAEGSAAQTTRVFRGLLTLACGKSSLGGTLREKIDDSYGRIERWKRGREKGLRRAIDVSAADMDAVISALPAEAARLSEFRFDAATLERLRPVLQAAAAR